MRRVVSVDRRSDELLVTSYTQMPSGVWRMNGCYWRLPVNAEERELSQSLQEALEVSNTQPVPEGGPGAGFDALLRELGIPDVLNYMKGALEVNVEVLKTGVIRVTPMRNGGGRSGFADIAEEAIDLDNPTGEALARAVVDAFARAR